MAQIPLPEHMRALAELAATKAATKVGDQMTALLKDHIQLCEARREVLPNGERPGLSTRVDRLEQERKRRNHRREVIIGILITVIGGLVIALLT